MSVKQNRRILGMLGFAMRAGKVLIGTDTVCRTVAKPNSGGIRLVLIASGASDATRKKLSSKCEFYGIQTVEIDMTTDELGSLLGKTYSPACAGITDESFASEIVKASSAEAN